MQSTHFATPPSSHAEYNTGWQPGQVPVYVEKPMARTYHGSYTWDVPKTAVRYSAMDFETTFTNIQQPLIEAIGSRPGSGLVKDFTHCTNGLCRSTGVSASRDQNRGYGVN